ncbi:hypothetical protein ETD86_41235 [Nonomuraea turkmeniaca]|uniref:Uncharacterized protein n=1 Tax=Nonomuraea turkmeniaca TaxID=103838 RepID=A0A5S4F236_9ACTN|nr:hypothetical protein ETD86_41235 [Nonomuraea turkmeniaca]
MSVAQSTLENLTGALYVVLLAGLVYLVLGRSNTKGPRSWAAVWGLSVVAGGLASLLLDPVAGLQAGFAAGAFVVAGLAVAAAPRKVLPAGAAVLVAVAAAPLVRGTPPQAFTVTSATWREQRPRLTIDVSYPRASGGDARRVNAALFAPIRERVEDTLRDLRADPAAHGTVTGTHVLVRDDAQVISVRYLLAGEQWRAVNYDVPAGRVLTVREIFTPVAFTPAGRRRLAAALRPLMPARQIPRTVSADNERLLVNLSRGAVEFTFGRGYFCTACEPFIVRASRERLAGLVTERP